MRPWTIQIVQSQLEGVNQHRIHLWKDKYIVCCKDRLNVGNPKGNLQIINYQQKELHPPLRSQKLGCLWACLGRPQSSCKLKWNFFEFSKYTKKIYEKAKSTEKYKAICKVSLLLALVLGLKCEASLLASIWVGWWQVFAGICILRLGTTGSNALALATPVTLRPVIVICLS